MTPPPSNPFNFILLALAAWGAVADWRYLSKGGTPATKGTGVKFLLAGLLYALSMIFLVFRGFEARAFGSLTGTLFLLVFAAWELRRYYVRKTNPVRTFK